MVFDSRSLCWIVSVDAGKNDYFIVVIMEDLKIFYDIWHLVQVTV